MDVNGARFHLVLGEREWLPDAGGSARGVEWAGGAVRLRKLLPVFPTHRGDEPPGIAARRGAARDRYGHWYWISDDRSEIRVSRLGRRPSTRFWSAADAARVCVDDAPASTFGMVTPAAVTPLELSGLAVTADHYLVVGRTTPNGLLIFDLRGGGAPLMLEWSASEPFTPFDLSATGDGGVWVLDRDARRLWRLDRFFRVLSASAPAATPASVVFVPLSGTDGALCPPPFPITGDLALPLAGVASPDAVESLADGSVLILDNPPDLAHSIVHRFRLDGTHFAIALDASLGPAPDPDDPGAPPLPLRGHDLAFVATEPVARPLTGSVYVASDSGNQSFAFEFASAEDAFTLTLRREYLPMRRFSGKGLVAAYGSVYYDLGERWIRLVEHSNPRFVRTGRLRLPGGARAFDGKEARCIWHRVLIDTCIPSESKVIVETRSADRADALADLPWQRQPDLYRRGDGSELPLHWPRIPGDARHAGTWELLLQDVVGRFLQVRLTIEGTGRTTPRLHALRVHYPRFSYLKAYLPAAYRDEPVSASFLDRYLANVEGLYTTLEGKIEHVEALFDPASVPPELLDWLASWFGASLEFDWPEATRRLFLAHVPLMFRERGTCAGLVRAIRLALDRCPTAALFEERPCAGANASGFGVRVVERYRARRAAGVVFGDPTELIGPGSTTNLSDWTPARGTQPLNAQYRAFLRERYAGDIGALNDAWGSTFSGFDDPELRLSALRPPGAQGTDWQRFVTAEIGFTYTVPNDEDETLYREFLARRYGLPSAMSQAYGLDGAAAIAGWSDVRSKLWNGSLRTALPENLVWLRDWIEFVSTVLPMERVAHRFTVLVPIRLEDGPERQLELRGIAARVTEIEKPAHSAFDVKLYWGLFRVGEARLGLDTLIGDGSRSAALVLDRGLVGGSHLGFVEPWNVLDRLVVGREGDPQPARAGTCCCGGAPPDAGGCGCKRG